MPQVRIDVRIDRAPKLIELLKAGEVDMVISVRFCQDFEGLVLKRSPAGWLCAADYVHHPEAPVPLIVADGSSVYRDMAVAALDRAHIRWNIARMVPDLVSIKAAIRAGLGITPRHIDLLAPDMRVLGPADHLPELPDVTFHLWIRPLPENAPARQAYEMLRDEWKLAEIAPGTVSAQPSAGDEGRQPSDAARSAPRAC